MIERSISRRRLAMSGLGAAALALTARGPLHVFAQSATPAASPAALDTFPVTVPHVFGETVIAAEPKRVVTWGWSSQDAVIALGTIPVAMPKYTWGGDADAVLPWVREALGGAPLPTLLPDAAVEVPMEEIAAVQPDLILAPYSGITEEDYGRLSQIAPTVAYPEKPWETSWQDQTTIIGAALGRSAQGKALVEQTTSYITGKATEFPAIAGKTFAYGTISADGAFRLYIPGDPRVQLLEDLGMAPSQFVLDLEVGDGIYYADISPELIGTLDCQILVMWFDDQSLADAALENPTFAALPMVKSGAYAPIVGQSFVMASSAPTVLSIPWMLHSYVPQLAAAAEKVEG